MVGRIGEIYLFRPLTDAADKWFRGPWLRYAEGQWINDDGEYDLAFWSLSAPMALGISMPHHERLLWSWTEGHWSHDNPKHPRGNPWHYMLQGKSWGRRINFSTQEQLPNSKAFRAAMDTCCAKHSCANGRGPEFHLGDPYITAGLVRTLAGEVVTFPEQLICCYCGPVEWPERLAKFRPIFASSEKETP